MNESPHWASYREVEHAMTELIAQEFVQQPFFQDLRDGRWKTSMIKYFSWQYAHYSPVSPLY